MKTAKPRYRHRVPTAREYHNGNKTGAKAPAYFHLVPLGRKPIDMFFYENMRIVDRPLPMALPWAVESPPLWGSIAEFNTKLSTTFEACQIIYLKNYMFDKQACQA